MSTIKAQNSWILPSLSVLMFTQSWKLTFHLQTSLTAPRYQKLCSACNTRDCMTVTLFRWRRDRFTSDPAQFCKGAEVTRKCDDQRLTKEFDHWMIQSLLVTVIVLNKWATQLDTPQWQKNHPHHSFSDLPDRKKYMTQRDRGFHDGSDPIDSSRFIIHHNSSYFVIHQMANEQAFQKWVQCRGVPIDRRDLQGRSFRGQEQKTLLWFFRFLHLQKLPEIKGSSRLILLTPDAGKTVEGIRTGPVLLHWYCMCLWICWSKKINTKVNKSNHICPAYLASRPWMTCSDSHPSSHMCCDISWNPNQVSGESLTNEPVKAFLIQVWHGAVRRELIWQH